jgi:hypothetical protein
MKRAAAFANGAARQRRHYPAFVAWPLQQDFYSVNRERSHPLANNCEHNRLSQVPRRRAGHFRPKNVVILSGAKKPAFCQNRHGCTVARRFSSRYGICTSPTQLANGGSVIVVVVAPIKDGSSVISVLTAVC